MTDADTALGLITIDLNAVAANYRHLAGIVGPGCRTAAVVKADAYGLGAVPVTHRLVDAGCRRFFVATPSEAIGLARAIADRRTPDSGIEIAVLDGVDGGSLPSFHAYGLIPVLSAPEQVRLWHEAGGGKPAILQLDSGMSRLGLSLAEIAPLAASGSFDGYAVDTVMSHLACADTPAHPMNESQRRNFDAGVAALPETIRRHAVLSLAASSGIFLGSGFHYGMVRPGAALWGLNPTPHTTNPMSQVVGIKAKIIQVLEIDAGRGVGYGAVYVAPGPRRIATVGVGYADGYPRAAGNRARAYIGDTRVKLVGRVSMDLTTFDVTGLPASAVGPGGLVELMGPHYGADDLARDSDTIGYEVLTRLSRRLHRSYLP
ncbi:MAG TPA: alanine racemase [Stellaceae bacterium]|jgi:alanine racemase|nr:alanine racemase [Stellaceae bacterium]